MKNVDRLSKQMSSALETIDGRIASGLESAADLNTRIKNRNNTPSRKARLWLYDFAKDIKAGYYVERPKFDDSFEGYARQFLFLELLDKGCLELNSAGFVTTTDWGSQILKSMHNPAVQFYLKRRSSILWTASLFLGSFLGFVFTRAFEAVFA